MSMRLQPCSGCSRHVRVGAATCPFCGASVSPRTEGSPARSAAARLSRAALFAAGTAGAAVAGLDCSAQPMYGGPGPYGQPLYGGVFPIDASMVQEASSPMPDASKMPEAAMPEASATPDASAMGEASTANDSSSAPDVPTAQPMYGAAIPDSGPPKDEDAPSVVALYGGFVPFDAETRAD